MISFDLKWALIFGIIISGAYVFFVTISRILHCNYKWLKITAVVSVLNTFFSMATFAFYNIRPYELIVYIFSCVLLYLPTYILMIPTVLEYRKKKKKSQEQSPETTQKQGKA